MKNKLKDQQLDEAFKLFYSWVRSLKEISEKSWLPAPTITAEFTKAWISLWTLKRNDNMYKL